jgi:hypothetical protein
VPALLFHQNMRTFAGDASRIEARMKAYRGKHPLRGERPLTWHNIGPAEGSFGFAGIGARLGDLAPSVCAVGLTELTNRNATARAARELTGLLMRSAPGEVLLFNCGVTALNKSEYSAIVLSRQVTPLAFGRVVAGGTYEDIEIERPPFDVERWGQVSGSGSLDYRFVVYAVVRLADGTVVGIGFIHNTYRLESRSTAAQRIGWYARRILENEVATPSHVYIGGDFNVGPHSPRDRPPLHPYWVDTERNTPYPFDLIDGRIGGTTWGGNSYDYWISDIPMGGAYPLPAISTDTWDGPKGLMSDHVAILLRVA